MGYEGVDCNTGILDDVHGNTGQVAGGCAIHLRKFFDMDCLVILVRPAVVNFFKAQMAKKSHRKAVATEVGMFRLSDSMQKLLAIRR